LDGPEFEFLQIEEIFLIQNGHTHSGANPTSYLIGTEAVSEGKAVRA
jgi:hypothetical protein